MLLVIVLFWILLLWGIKSEELYWQEALWFILAWAICVMLMVFKLGPPAIWIVGMILLDIILIFKNGIVDAKAF